MMLQPFQEFDSVYNRVLYQSTTINCPTHTDILGMVFIDTSLCKCVSRPVICALCRAVTYVSLRDISGARGGFYNLLPDVSMAMLW